jgi:hypothetical protein
MNQVQKKVSQTDIHIRQNESVDPFGENVCASLSYKKAERIVVAINIIAGRIKDNESLKSAVVSLTTNLITDTLSLRGGFQASGGDKVNDIVASVRLIMTHLDVLHVSGNLSENNLKVIKDACTRFVAFLKSSENSPIADALSLGDEYFAEPAEESLPLQSVAIIRQKAQVHPVARAHAVAVSADQSASNPSTDHRYMPKANHDRRGALLAVIESRGKVMIKDLVVVVPGVSEKTIQRELQSMILDGVLQKEGERRWTTYSRRVAG